MNNTLQDNNIINIQPYGFVQLIDHIGTDKRILDAARVSYTGFSKFNPNELEINERDKKLLKFLIKHRHTSPLEHVIFTFHIKCPIFIARQWMRHRTGKYNEASYRYKQAPDQFFLPKQLRLQSKTNAQSSQGYHEDSNKYISKINEMHQKCYDLYKEMIDAGVAREQARMILPTSIYTEFWFTIDLHNLLHFIDLRSHEGAQEEIQEYAKAMLELIKIYVPFAIDIKFNNEENDI